MRNGWPYSRVKFHCTMNSGDNITSQDIEEDAAYPVYGGNGFRGYYSRYNQDGKFLLVGRQGALAGNVHRVEGKFWATDHAVVTRVFADTDLDFFYYLLLRLDLNQYAFETAAQPGLAVSKIRELGIEFPPIVDQRRIADFLDAKCAEIDTLVVDIQAQIETLEQYKQSVITEAVTKGLDPDAPMKDSRIQWIGKVPTNWRTENPKYHFTQRQDRAEKGMIQLTASQKYGVVTQTEYMELTGARIVTVQKDFDILKKVCAGDFIIHMRSFQGGLEYSTMTGSISSAYVMLIPKESISEPRYYRWFFKSSAYIDALSSTSNLVRDGQAMRWANFIQLPITIPPAHEQTAIADYLDAKCAEIDSIIADKHTQLDVINEYKKSLIFEYVTGKKEVPVV